MHELLVSELQKIIGGHRVCFSDKTCGKYPDLEKLAHVIQHGLREFIVKNIEGESTAANDVSYFIEVGLSHK